MSHLDEQPLQLKRISTLAQAHCRSLLQKFRQTFHHAKKKKSFLKGISASHVCIPVSVVRRCCVRVQDWHLASLGIFVLVWSTRVGWKSVVVVAVRAQNLTAVGEEAGAHQRDGAARTLEARLVPLPVLERNVLPVSETCRDTRQPVSKRAAPRPHTEAFKNRLVATLLAHELQIRSAVDGRHNRGLPGQWSLGAEASELSASLY